MEDRLSSLHDDILIRIITHLPFPYVVITECLSSRWRGLWTHLTSIKIKRLKRKPSLEFFTSINHLLRRIKSPCIIDSFNVRLGYTSCFMTPLPSIDSWIESLTNNRKDIRDFKVRLPLILGISFPVLQRFILQTRMLVSLRCDRLLDCQLLSSHVEFNLPNLTKLILCFETGKNINEWLKKLVQGCPLLVTLSLCCNNNIGDMGSATNYIECWNQNLRRLTIDFQTSERGDRVVINAPKLEYLAVWCTNYPAFCFDKLPIALHEARITISHFRGGSSTEENMLWSRFYEGISSATVLVLDALHIPHLSNVFCNATRLTIDVRKLVKIRTVQYLPELFPVLNFLTLRFYSEYMGGKLWMTLPCCWPLYNLEIVEYLLSNAVNLVHLKYYDLTKSESWGNKGVELLQRNELDFCKRLYMCPIASKVSVIEFIGKTFKMSRKVGQEAWSESNIANLLSCAPYKRFTVCEE